MYVKRHVLRFAAALALAAGAATVAMSAPPAQEALVKACDEADTALQCERMLEAAQLKQFPGVATRDGKTLRMPTRPGMPNVELRDVGDPDNDTGADYRAYSFWDYWRDPGIAIVSVMTRDSDYYLLVELARGTQVKLGGEPLLAPDGKRFAVVDMCDKGCGNQIQVWRIERDRAVREKSFKPVEKWYETELSWRDASMLALDYSVAAPRRRLADPGELTLIKAKPRELKLSDSDWVSDEPRR